MAKKVSGIGEATKRFNNISNKKAVGKALQRGKKTKETSHILAINKDGKTYQGSQRKVADNLGTTANTVSTRINATKGNKFGREIDGFTIIRFATADELVKFKSEFKNDKVGGKKKLSKSQQTAGQIEEGMGFLEAQQPQYKIVKGKSIKNPFWGTNEDRFSLNLKETNLELDQVEQVFADTIKLTKEKQKLKSNDKIRVIIEDPNLKFFVSTSLMDAGSISGQDIMDLIGEVVESNQDWQVGPETNISITSINIPSGGNSGSGTDWKTFKGGSSKEPETIIGETSALKKKEQALLKFNKKSIIRIINPKDDLCMARCIAVGIFRDKYGTKHPKYKQILKDSKSIQFKTAQKLHEQAGVEEGVCGIEELKVFEDFTKYQITIIDGDFFNQIVYPDINSKSYKSPDEDSKTIYLYKNGNHYDLIASNKVAGFFSKDNFCHKCKKTYKKKDAHKCIFKCNMCCRSDCPVNKIPLRDRKYDNQCEGCLRWFCNLTCKDNHLLPDKKGVSICGKMWKCQECKKLLMREKFPPESHKCGDYECGNCKQIVQEGHKCYMFPKQIKEPSDKYIFFDFEADISDTEHKVMYSVSQYYHDPTPIIHNSIEEFCIWAFQEEHKGYTFIAHNGRGYDYKFIIRWVFDNTLYKPFTIFAGCKIMCMSIQQLKIKFIDSLSFLTMALKEFPKTFGLKELRKGFYPHWFNTKENWDYIGKMPDIKYFKHNQMKAKDRKDFLVWYEGKVAEDYVWNQQEEMKLYCISDVDILRRSCIIFRDLYLKTCRIDPFQYLTIASVCMSIYKYNFIDTTYPERWEALYDKWGQYMNGGDPSKQDPQYKIDREAFDKETRENVFREKKIAIFAYEDVQWYRKAFFGGRTNAVKLLYNFKEGEEGKYSDITSLYPTVQYYDKYPKGHPKTIKEENITEEDYERVKKGEYFGFIDIQLTPPKDLYHPVLPHKTDKLVFDLITKRGVWCSNEVKKAIDKGYVIDKIYEIRHFSGTTKNLFKDYVKWFLKIKQEASGYPDWVCNEKDKDLYIEQYQKRQGILLDKDKIVKNPGLRAIAKLCLNSLWGKFGQRTNMGKTEIIDNKASFLEIVLNEKYENVQWIELNNNKMEISYQLKDKYVENDYNTNIAIACFTTSSARLRLYEALETLDRQILYFDTDSCVYKYNPNDEECNKKLPNGDLLGDWTDELEGVKMIKTFVSGGPKNYSYETDDGKYHTKVKGFNLNYEVGLSINHNSMIKLVQDTLANPIDKEELVGLSKEEKEEVLSNHKIGVEYNMIKRTKEHTLESFVQHKNYGLVYTKRDILEPDEFGNYDTRPFGWKY